MFGKAKLIIKDQMTQGLGTRDCARAIAVSLTIGVFPIMGCSTPMNTVAAAGFRLNQPIVQAFNWLCAPLKIALIFPFLRFGEWLFQVEPFTLSLVEFSEIFFADWIGTTQAFAWTFVHAIIGWLVCAPLIYLSLYFVAKPILEQRMSNVGRARA